jgi:phenylacetate-CoA ligase
MEDKHLPPIECEVVGCYSEQIEPAFMELLKHNFRGRYLDYYGNRENTIAAWGNCDGLFYEVSQYCHFELLSDQAPNEGQLVTTSLHNYAFPLIRYCPDDYVHMLGYDDPAQPYPQVKLIGGRGKNLLLSRKGLTAPYILTYLQKKNFYKFTKYQIEQKTLDDIIFRMVPTEDYDPAAEEATLLKYLHDGALKMFNITIEYVDDIPLTSAGKYIHVISELAKKYFEEKQAEKQKG